MCFLFKDTVILFLNSYEWAFKGILTCGQDTSMKFTNDACLKSLSDDATVVIHKFPTGNYLPLNKSDFCEHSNEILVVQWNHSLRACRATSWLWLLCHHAALPVWHINTRGRHFTASWHGLLRWRGWGFCFLCRFGANELKKKRISKRSTRYLYNVNFII